jgi:hypothetical protein
MDTRLSIENMQIMTLQATSDPPVDAIRTEIRIWEKRVDDYVKRDTILKENIKTTYSLIWGQCTDLMRQKIEATKSFTSISQDGDATELLKIIKDIAYNFQAQKYTPQVLHEAKKKFYNCYQACHQTTQVYLENFQKHIKVINHIGGSNGMDTIMISKVAKDLKKEPSELSHEERNKAQEEYIATAFLIGANQNQFGKLLDKRQNDHLQGYNGYPQILSAAYNLLVNWKSETQQGGKSNNGISFATYSNNGPGTSQRNARNNTHVTCYRCGMSGHYANQCVSNNASVNSRSGSTYIGSNTIENTNEPGIEHDNTLMLAGVVDNEDKHQNSPSFTIKIPFHTT